MTPPELDVVGALYRKEFLKDLPTMILITRITFISIFTVIGLEYVTKRLGWHKLRPSTILHYIYDTLFHPTAIWLGYLYADVMGFLYAIDISELVYCICDVGLQFMLLGKWSFYLIAVDVVFVALITASLKTAKQEEETSTKRPRQRRNNGLK